MDTSTLGKIEMGLECLPTDETRREYENYLATDLSGENANDLHQIFDCFRRAGETERCLGDTARPPLNRDAIRLCQETAGLGEIFIRDHRNRSDFAAGLLPLQPTGIHFPSFSDVEREALNIISTFYASRLTGFRYLEEVKEHLRARPSWARRLVAYESRTEEPTTLTHPALCSSPQDWERHDLRVDGLSYTIPFFLPRGRAHAWPLFEETFLIGFELLKVFLTPYELDHLLHPGDWPDIAFFLGGQYSNSDDAFDNCGVLTNDQFNGEFYYFINRIALRYPHPWSLSLTPTLNISWPEAFTNYLGDFLHEMGHAIEFAFLRNRPKIHSSLTSLDAWSAGRFNPDSYQEGIVPLIYYSPRFGPLGEQRHSLAQPYGLKDEWEFFAEMVKEFVLFETSALWTIDNQHYWTSFYQARRQMMMDFFSPEGINPEALTEERIETAYRSAGVPVSLPTVWAGTLGAGFSVGPTGQGDIELFGDYATSPMSSDLSLGLGAVINFGTGLNRARLETEVSLSSNLSQDLRISLFGRGGIGYADVSPPVHPVMTTGARIAYHILFPGFFPDLQLQLGLSYSIVDDTSESAWSSNFRVGLGF